MLYNITNTSDRYNKTMILIQVMASYPQYINFICEKCGQEDVYIDTECFCYHCSAPLVNYDGVYRMAKERLKYHQKRKNLNASNKV